MQTYEKDKVVLSSNLMVQSLLDDLFKREIINMSTYNKAMKEIKDNGDNK